LYSGAQVSSACFGQWPQYKLCGIGMFDQYLYFDRPETIRHPTVVMVTPRDPPPDSRHMVTPRDPPPDSRHMVTPRRSECTRKTIKIIVKTILISLLAF